MMQALRCCQQADSGSSRHGFRPSHDSLSNMAGAKTWSGGFGRDEPLEFNPGIWYLTGAVIRRSVLGLIVLGSFEISAREVRLDAACLRFPFNPLKALEEDTMERRPTIPNHNDTTQSDSAITSDCVYSVLTVD